MKRKLAIIGASDFQNPLILKAKDMGLETHVFAWASGDVGETTADYFYPISITDHDEITEKCREIGIDGICTIGTDLGNIAVSVVANKLGLCANSLDCIAVSTNKHLMREAFKKGGDPSPKSYQIKNGEPICDFDLEYPIIVKPVDRSGSRSITKLNSPEGLEEAVRSAMAVSFAGAAVVEEFFTGVEYSVEFISWQGEHHFLALTRKFTTGAPHFIETGHIEPANVSDKILTRVKSVVSHALDTLGVEYGASHSEILINEEGDIRIVEIGSRMGGDCIGSDLVPLSTGVDFLAAVISVALGQEPSLEPAAHYDAAMIRFMFSKDDLAVLSALQEESPELVEKFSIANDLSHEIVDSSSRYGFYILKSYNRGILVQHLPEGVEDC